MRPLFDLRFFADLPKFLWFDNGDGSGGPGSGGPGSGNAGTGSNASANAGNSSAGPGGIGSDAAATGDEGGPAGDSVSVAAPGSATAPTGEVSAAAQASVNASAAEAAAQAARGGQGAATGAGGAATGGPGAATGAGGAATGGPGAATGGGGGTASGGSGISASVRSALQALLGGGATSTDALRGAVRNSELDFGGVAGVPSLGVPEGVGGQGAAPVGQVTVSPLGPPSPNLVSLAQQLFGSQAAQAARGSGSSTSNAANLGPTLGGQAPTAATTMGFPAAGLANTPGGGVAPSNAAPVGSTIGQATISSPSGGPNAPAVMAQNAADTSPGGQTSGLGSAAPASQAVSSPSSQAPPAPDIGGLLQLVLSLVMGGQAGPQLSQLAQNRPRG
jgi:hypothetical protein